MALNGFSVQLDDAWADDPWFRFPRAFARDADLSWSARGLAAWMASHSSTYKFRMAEIIKAGDAGRDKIRNMIKELVAAGYLDRHQERNADGTMSADVAFRLRPVARQEIRRSETCTPAAAQQKPRSEPATDLPSPVNPPPYREKQVLREETKKQAGSVEACAAGEGSACLPADAPQAENGSGERPESPGAALLRGLTISGGAVSAQVVRQHHQAVTELLRTWPAEKLATHLTRETSTGPVANPMGLLVSVLRDTQPLPHAQPRPAPARLTPPCGACDGRPNEPVSTRVLWLDTDKTKSQPCPQCHPAARTPQPTRNAL